MSDFSFKCSFCNQLLAAPLEFMGKEVQCPSCKNKIMLSNSTTDNTPLTTTIPPPNAHVNGNAQPNVENQRNSANNSSGETLFASTAISRLQGTAIIALLSAGMLFLALIGLSNIFGFQVHDVPQWEYFTVEVPAALVNYDSSLTTDRKNLLSTTIPNFYDTLRIHGNAGWELVNAYLEFETVHANFGNADYVTGIQPNVRPQKLVCIFKRQKKKET